MLSNLFISLLTFIPFYLLVTNDEVNNTNNKHTKIEQHRLKLKYCCSVASAFDIHFQPCSENVGLRRAANLKKEL